MMKVVGGHTASALSIRATFLSLLIHVRGLHHPKGFNNHFQLGRRCILVEEPVA